MIRSFGDKATALVFRGGLPRGMARELAWMVGNSPKSDINPALEAGLNAAYVPHSRTWVLEREELRPTGGAGRLLVLENFAGLREHF